MKTKKINRFAVRTYKNGVLTSEIIPTSSPITIGSSYLSDLTIENAKREKVNFLKRTSKNCFQLIIPIGVEGTINKKDSKVPFTALMDLELVDKKGANYVVDLTTKNNKWGEITEGDTNITFGFHEEEIWIVEKPGLKRLELLFILSLIISTALHVSMTVYLKSREVKDISQIEALKQLPKRFARLVLTPKPKPKVEKKVEVKEEKLEEKKEEKKVEKKAEVKEEKPETKKPKVKPKRKKPVSKKLQTRVSSKGLLGVIGATGGIMSSMGSSDWNKMDSLIASSTRAVVADAGTSLDDLGSGELTDLDIEVQEKAKIRSEEEILKDKEQSRIKDKKKKAGITKTTVERNESQVYAKITSYIGGLKYLYNNRLRANPTLRGSISILITIDPDGTVSKTSVKNSTLNDPELETSITKRIKRWKFNPLENSTPYSISYTFDFSPVN